MTTTFPRSEDSLSEPSPFRRFSVKSFGHRPVPFRERLRDGGLLVVDDLPAEEHEERGDEPDRADLACELRAEHLGSDDEDRRPDVDDVEQPLGVADVHPDAAV